MADIQQFEGKEVDHSSGDKAAKFWFLMSVIWFPIFATFGFLLAVKFFFPEFLGTESWLTFGVIRPAHTNGVLFGFVSSGLIGTMLWIPRVSVLPNFSVPNWRC